MADSKGEVIIKKRHKIFNTFVDGYSLEETISEIEDLIQSKQSSYQVSLNADKINKIQKDSALKEVIDSADIINADGISIVWGAKFLGIDIGERVTGIDIFLNLLAVSEKRGYQVYFLGATEESLSNMLDKIKEDYPKLKIGGARNGYYDKNSEEVILQKIQDSQSDILFLGFSSPQKELWIKQHRNDLSVSFIMGVGGSFDVLSGQTKRAPELFQKLGLEWLCRYIQEPVRLFKRYIIGNVIFLNLLIKEKIS